MTEDTSRGQSTRSFLQMLAELLDQHAKGLPPEHAQRLREEVARIVTYQATIGVMGKSGAGKSALCNALFGKEVAKVSDVDAGTHTPQSIPLLDPQGNGITLIDMPGVGESLHSDASYRQLYQQLIPRLDLVLWVIKGDDRALSLDEQFYQQILLPEMAQLQLPVIVVVSQVDKIEPSREWDWKLNQPGPYQYLNIAAKVLQVCQRFRLLRNQVCAVSAEEGYGLTTLVEAIITQLPHDKRWSIAREAQQGTVNEQAMQATLQGLWHSLKRRLGELARLSWDKLGEKCALLVTRWFRRW